MDGALSSSNNFSPVRICSERHCKAILHPDQIKGNLCQQCVARMRLPRASTSKTVPNELVIPSHLTPGTSEKSLSGLNMLVESTNSKSRTESSTDELPSDYIPNIASHTSGPHTGRLQRSSFAIPHQQPSISRRSSSSSVVPAGQGPPLLNHFNSRGELINFATRDFRDVAKSHALNVQSRHTICSRCKSSVPARFGTDVCPSCRFETSTLRRTVTSLAKTVTPLQEKPVFVDSARRSISQPVNTDALSISDSKANIKTNEEANMEDLELVYPETPDTQIVTPSEPAPVEQIYPSLRISHQQLPISPPPQKRRKTSNYYRNQSSALPISRRSSANKSSTYSTPTSGLNASGKNKSLKLCATTNCTGIVSVNSFATRCLDCVKNNWKSQRAKLSSNADLIKKTVPAAPGTSKKRSVTWSDEILDRSYTKEKGPSNPLLEKEELSADCDTSTSTLSSSVNITMSSNMSSAENLKHRLGVNVPLESDSQFQDASLQPSNNAPAAISTESVMNCENLSDNLPELGAHLDKPQLPSSQLSGTETAVSAAVSESFSDLFSLNPDPISGWDSDLTELSDSGDHTNSEEGSSADESDTSTQGRPTSRPTSLKIRIPARPGGVYTPKCASLKCSQTLAPGYRWKSCLLCRARSREYQRRRQNIQVGHLRLEQELNQAQNMGMSMPENHLRRHRSKEKDSTILVPGARLCSVRDCSYIVPPFEEYHWKMCSLCRLRRRDQNKRDRQEGPGISENETRKKARYAEMLLKLNSPVFTASTRPSGRCQSLDCGMLVTDANSSQCEQCVARRIWLMKRSGHCPSGTGYYPGTSRNMSPYPQFKCFSALLLEFKNRLSGFLHAQSVFFLFKNPGSVNSVFAFDGEYSVCAVDFDLLRRKEDIDRNALELKREFEHVGRIKFSPKRLVSILDGGGIAIRFGCMYPVPILQPEKREDQISVTTVSKHMQCELEIAHLPDHSHRFIPGQRTIIRFRLLG